mmetsp:Transcript_25935/g.80918  ORF Transcript_25935/g.80918 Transcript_25935/m.80918 type:complete len:92 (+) Transcript_25935:648-923(+)
MAYSTRSQFDTLVGIGVLASLEMVRDVLFRCVQMQNRHVIQDCALQVLVNMCAKMFAKFWAKHCEPVSLHQWYAIVEFIAEMVGDVLMEQL